MTALHHLALQNLAPQFVARAVLALYHLQAFTLVAAC